MAAFELTVTLSQGSFLLDVEIVTDAGSLALFGPSGSGKTSLIEAIAGVRRPTAGRIAVRGTVFFDGARGVSVPSRHRCVGYVPQDVLLFPHLDVRGNILYGRRANGPDFGHVADLLELEPLLGRGVVSLSGGERQRVALARALLSRPTLLLLDEPLAAVDLPRRQQIASALVRIRRELAVPIVYVTHAPDEAIAIGEHAVVLESGRVAASGPPDVVLSGRLIRTEG